MIVIKINHHSLILWNMQIYFCFSYNTCLITLIAASVTENITHNTIISHNEHVRKEKGANDLAKKS